MTSFESRGYYWCLHQCEYATDILFKSREGLKAIYPFLVEHSSLKLMGEDIFTFFGRKNTFRTFGLNTNWIRIH